MQTNNRYLVQPIGALRIIKRNHSLIAEANHPLAAVQVRHGQQLFAEHEHQTSSREPQSEPAMRGDGFLSPRCHQMGQRWTKLR